MTDEQFGELKLQLTAQIAEAVDLLKVHIDNRIGMGEARTADHFDRRIKRLDDRTEQLASGLTPIVHV